MNGDGDAPTITPAPTPPAHLHTFTSVKLSVRAPSPHHPRLVFCRRQSPFPYTSPPTLLFCYNILALKATTLLVAVEDNASVMKAGPGALLGSSNGSGSGGLRSSNRYMTVSSYLEAVGVLACHKAGVNPVCLTPEEAPIRQMPPTPAVALEAAAAAAARGGVAEDAGSSGVAVVQQPHETHAFAAA